MVALGLLVAAMVVWAALPLGTAVLIRLVLIVAVLSGLLALIRLAVIQLAPGGRAGPGRDRGLALYDWPGSGLWQWLRELPGALPWGQVLIVAVLVLEALHPARPWHTAVLATLLLGFLVAAHLAESYAGAGSGGSGARGLAVFAPLLPFIVAGVALAWLSVGAAALPGAGAGASSGWVAVLAAVAAIVVAALALPV
jgi:hypothetical protein